MAAQEPRMRVMARPAFENKHLNPYNWQLYTELEDNDVDVLDYEPLRLLREEFDILHIHWPENPLNQPGLLYPIRRSLGLLATMDFARGKGARTVWTVHNLESHDRLHPNLEDWFWNWFTRRLDGFISLSQAGVRAAIERFPVLEDLPHAVIPHGDYRGVYPDQPSKEEARERLGIPQDKTTLGYFGMIRPYKNVPGLIRAFKGIKEEPYQLLISGNPVHEGLEERIRDAAGEDIHLHLRHISHDDVPAHLAAMDLLCLPYEEILNSGTALLGLTFHRPVLAPRLGALPELQRTVGGDWIHLYERDLGPETLREAADWATGQGRDAPDLEPFSWTRLGEKTLTFYDRLLP